MGSHGGRAGDTVVQQPPAACLFDLDGLLLDTEPLHGRAWREAARHFGVELSEARLLQLRGRRRLDCAAAVRGWLQRDAGLTVSDEALLAVQQPVVRALLPAARPIPGARRLLEHCRDLGLPAAMVTSSTAAAAALKLSPHPWLEALLPVRVHGDDPDLRAGKPEPDPYLLGALRLGVPPDRCWAFEDSLAGARSAAAAGCTVIVLVAEAVEPDGFPPGCRRVRHLEEVLADWPAPCDPSAALRTGG
ncbi:HAD family phosphatase [Synechococcus sp. RSCCF101]|uniref:HAD family hydrolase n=1 Tax=Synechococcus sp. RSCCF101 TaxID=2511069 RepID=UPI0012482153|nr:HAD family phosphatase [Synechococcus sp. RSCCF101]QEY31464.1 HAD family phosphatase [Synechococcus sp. RSCCF101]